MSRWIATDRIVPGPGTCAMAGRIDWDPAQSLWTIGHGVGAVLAVTLFPGAGAAAVFVALTAVTICAGHSVGMHRC